MNTETLSVRPVVLHIPHSSQEIPPDIRPQFLLDDFQLDAELLAMTDAHTEQLFKDLLPGAQEIVFPVSRLVVDPERFEDDADEPMSAVGMGVVYTRGSKGNPLRQSISSEAREQLLARFYRPHHEALTAAVAALLAHHGSCLLIDCHSFPSVPLPYELCQDPERPDICIGTDPFHTPESLIGRLQDAFRAHGLSTSRNRPFEGSIVPSAFYRRNVAARSVMIEVNRRLYMDEATGTRLPDFERVRSILRQAVGAAVRNGDYLSGSAA